MKNLVVIALLVITVLLTPATSWAGGHHRGGDCRGYYRGDCHRDDGAVAVGLGLGLGLGLLAQPVYAVPVFQAPVQTEVLVVRGSSPYPGGYYDDQAWANEQFRQSQAWANEQLRIEQARANEQARLNQAWANEQYRQSRARANQRVQSLPPPRLADGEFRSIPVSHGGMRSPRR